MIDLKAYSHDVFARLETDGYQSLSDHDKVFACVWGSTTAIKKGGFEQWYSSTSGDWAQETPAAYREIGALKSAEIIEKANAVFGAKGPSPVDNVRYEQLGRLSEEDSNILYALRERFDARPDNILFLLMDYLETR